VKLDFHASRLSGFELLLAVSEIEEYNIPEPRYTVIVSVASANNTAKLQWPSAGRWTDYNTDAERG
jgi:hypothetical protein